MIEFFAPGQPQPKGSSRAFVSQRTGRAIITNDNPRTKPWAAVVTLSAQRAVQGDPFSGPVRVRLGFVMARPKAHYGAKGLRPDAPEFVSRRPDIDKLARTVLDALTLAGIWQDDSQVAELVCEKIYGVTPGVRVIVEAVP